MYAILSSINYALSVSGNGQWARDIYHVEKKESGNTRRM